MRCMTIGLLLVAGVCGGCAHLRPAASGAAPASAPVPARPAQPAAPAPTGAAPASPAAIAIAQPDVATAPATAAQGPVATPAANANSEASERSKPPVAAASTPARPAASVVGGAPAAQAATRPRAPEAGTAAPKPAVAPTLDLSSLEQRLRDTRCIGLFTKLSLKNQVDDLLSQFRAYYRAQPRAPTPELRQRFDGLLLKVISLLQDGDPPLAAAIVSSREALWGILADPEKLSKI